MIAVSFRSHIKMIRSPFTSVTIPNIAVHDVVLLACKTNADKKALVSMLLLLEYSFFFVASLGGIVFLKCCDILLYTFLLPLSGEIKLIYKLKMNF